jgi:GNAT superfamily N-acetyltransferase
VGFLFAMCLPSFKGRRAAFSPDWANGAQAEDAPRIYQALYAALAPRWLANGCVVHALSVLAHDRPGLDGLYWLGFGINNVDAIRDLAPVPSPGGVSDLIIRRATGQDVDDVARLGEGLQRHLAATPIYLPYVQPDTRADYVEWLAQPGNVQWLAYRDDIPIAELRREPTNYTASAMAADPGTTFITSAYTTPSARNAGVASALLAKLLEDARACGCERCATDFESANLSGARFWMRDFQPITYSVLRYVDERSLYAHAERQAADLW